MSERGVSATDVLRVLTDGDVVEMYPEDLPYPSRLVLGWQDARPLHVVTADETGTTKTIVVTVYEPDPIRWMPDFRTRRTS